MHSTRLVGMFVLCSLVAALPVLAHGGKTHVMGTVAAVDATHLTVQTREGKSVSIRLNDETKYRNGDAPAKSGDVKVGNRVVVDLTGSDDNPEAGEVRFSSEGVKQGHGPDGHGEKHRHHGE